MKWILTLGILALIVVIAYLRLEGSQQSKEQAFDINKVVRSMLDQRELECLALNIYFESRAESLAGRLAVAQTTMNRVWSTRFPNTICDVVYEGRHRDGLPLRDMCQFSWYCDGQHDVPTQKKSWDQSLALAERVVRSGKWMIDITDGATHFHAEYVDPRWSTQYKRIMQIDTHIFYKQVFAF